ncbi:diol dehydratase reactivase ATPase-like domain-containing protein [Mycolicibacterium fortuitum]|uniref:Diol dehydratase reactivation protein n=1 Tax=Mycolicibacterium fortuitum subsp. fortuitum DSM 46621 = ATCC 6841 = JCM 6387 TaxID=1214102 RepID=K0VCF1_MYCFO|nr:diol dehydratase reactivase ATPase-like domain-containing protein [Mycolicibacterium fortuitum]AIY49859.2 Propanediol dehydratase reactivation factor large subunit [Mycobacterium sp. VKM Ac-1817D]EJZ12488.1 diol dehydratase reactivation protein [Mycolicibacterium fortuitum subsp. fortuitum DSM 46621 = ATCC 6841 = JCM 6387]CRL78606.1 diol dehydratase reactivation protein [Mycolicibacter nonchromogenicus]WEV32498.1 diol dehydratase reactivase [Mycolicibacterium fortuitum]CRL55870.1 diol dehyd
MTLTDFRRTRVVAGIDVGNHTTEIVLARIRAGLVEPIVQGQAPTRGRKGSRDSLEGAAALLHRIEVDAEVRADELVLSAIRPVDTETAPLAPAPSPRSPVRSLRKPDASTPAGAGFAVGRHVPLGELAGETRPGPVIVSVDDVTDFEVAAAAITDAVDNGWSIVGVLAAQDDAVLIRNRIPLVVPVVDEVMLDGLNPGALVAVEVVAEGRAYRALADPIALCAALELGPEQIHDVADFTRELADSPAIAVTARTEPLEPPAVDDDYVEFRIDGVPVRYSPAQAHAILRREPPGSVVRIRLRSIPTADGEIAVDDAFFTDLAALDSGTWLRRGVAEARGTVVALLAADHVEDAATTLAELTGRPARTIATEPEAAARGARTTPGLPPESVVCDIGGGTIDLIGSERTVTAAGAGESITVAVARMLNIPRALAERVKRTPAIRVEGPHVAHEEDGRRLFLDAPAPADAIGRLCTRGTAGLVPFSTKLAAEEWRSLRLAIKQETVAANIARCLAAFEKPPPALVLAGGGALDDELLRTVGESLRSVGVVVGRANIDGVHGPRFAVASGLVHLSAG